MEELRTCRKTVSKFLGRALWEVYRRKVNKSSQRLRIGGPHEIRYHYSSRTLKMCGFKKQYGIRLFSPSGQYMLDGIYNKDGQAHILELVDFSNRRSNLYFKEPREPSASELETKQIIAIYWTANARFIIVYFKNSVQLIQCVYTLNHGKRRFTEERYDYEDIANIPLFCRRLHGCQPNPLIMQGREYFACFCRDTIYLLPWYPLREHNLNVVRITIRPSDLNFNDGFFLDGQIHIFGSKIFFERALPGDFPREYQLNDNVQSETPSLELVTFGRNPAEAELLLPEIHYDPTLNFFMTSGRYLLFEAMLTVYGERQYFFFNMDTQTVDGPPRPYRNYRSSTASVATHPHLNFYFYDKKDKSFFVYNEKVKFPGVETLAEMCRKRLILSQTPITVNESIMRIVFPGEP